MHAGRVSFPADPVARKVASMKSFAGFPGLLFESVSLLIDRTGVAFSVPNFGLRDLVDHVDFSFGFYNRLQRRVRLSARELGVDWVRDGVTSSRRTAGPSVPWSPLCTCIDLSSQTKEVSSRHTPACAGVGWNTGLSEILREIR